MYCIFAIPIIIVLPWLWYYSGDIMCKIQELKDTYKNKLVLYAISQVANIQANESKKAPFSFTIADNCEHATIKLDGKVILLPYDLDLSMSMNNSKVFIKYLDKPAEQVFLYPGIPPKITPDNLEAEYIEVINEDGGKTKFTGGEYVVF